MYTLIVGSRSFVLDNQKAHEVGLQAKAAYDEGQYDASKTFLALAVRIENGQASGEDLSNLRQAA